MQYPDHLSKKERLIAELLVEHGELFGSTLVDCSEGLLARGTVYVTLARMEEKELVRSRLLEAVKGQLPRRAYKVTPLGKRVLGAMTAAEAHMARARRA